MKKKPNTTQLVKVEHQPDNSLMLYRYIGKEMKQKAVMSIDELSQQQMVEVIDHFRKEGIEE